MSAFKEQKLRVAGIIAAEYIELNKLKRMVDNPPRGNEESYEWFCDLLDQIKRKDFDPKVRDEIRQNIIRIIGSRITEHEEKIEKIVTTNSTYIGF